MRFVTRWCRGFVPLVGFALALFCGSGRAEAQVVYGITALALDTEFDHAYGYSATLLDYDACYYYDAAVVGTLYEGTTVVDQGAVHGICSAEVYTDAPTHDNLFYTEWSDHHLIAYIYYYYGGYYDPFGFSFFGSGDHGGGFGFFGCYCPVYFAPANLDLGSTEVTLFNDDPCDGTPELDVSPSSVTRGQPATFTLKKVCTAASVSGWTFSEGGHTVSRGAGSERTWSGTMVTSGTVSVTVTQGGQTHHPSKSITVNPRSGWAFPPVPATKMANGLYNCGSFNLKVPDPPRDMDGERGFGHFCIWTPSVKSSEPTWLRLGDGPNAGYRYVRSATDTTVFAWVITPQLEDPGSDLYRAQCGRDGVISGSQLRSNTIAHESGMVNSHYSRYVAAQNDPANNLGVGYEAVVAPPGETDDQWRARLSAAFEPRSDRISAAAEVEPCVDVTYDESCTTSHGTIHYTPYTPCSPLTLAAVASASPRQVALTWVDGSFNEEGFVLARQDGGAGEFYELTRVGANVTSAVDTDVEPGVAYAYRIQAFAHQPPKYSPRSNVATATIPPEGPTGLSAVASSGRIDLAWSYAVADDPFVVERQSGAASFTAIGGAPAGARSYADTTVAPGTAYSYRVFATTAAGSSALSSEASATTPGTPPPVGAPPAAPCCLWGESYAGFGTLTLWWGDRSSDEDLFAIERRGPWDAEFYPVAWALPNATTATDSGLQQGETYEYRIVAENAFGQSASDAFVYYAPYWWEQ